jgi:glycosyltransferase involved in cell wall biosynthesis
MKIIIHDYSGHPFQVQLSRALARRQHQVLHVYSGFFQTPHGSVKKLTTDPDNFDCTALFLSQPFAKYSFFKRRFQEIEYGKLVCREVDKFAPDVVVSSNMPLDPQNILLRKCKYNGIKFIFWLQDLYSNAIKSILTKKYSLLGKMIGLYYEWLEISMLRKSNHIVVITDDFLGILRNSGINGNKIHVIYNWAPLEEIPLRPKDNDWSRTHDLHDKLVILYSGTLGLKHNPQLIYKVAKQLQSREEMKIVVISEGPGADYLKQKQNELNLRNLLLLGFQPFEILPEILACADILVAILEQEAGVFSVPSKVLTYHCAGRPLLLAMPRDNLAARIVEEYQTGLVVNPDDEAGFFKETERLLKNSHLRQLYGENARRYAENTFNIEHITDKFEKIITN